MMLAKEGNIQEERMASQTLQTFAFYVLVWIGSNIL